MRVDVRAVLVGDRVVGIPVRVLVLLARGVRALGVELVGERRLLRLVMRRQRAVLEPLRDEEPGAPVGLHDERMVAGDRLFGLRAVGRDVVRGLVLLEVGNVLALPLGAVPPDVLLSLRPRLSVGIRGGAVVDDAPVRRPCPRPLGRDVALLPVRLLPRRLVDPVGINAAVDPAAAHRRAVVLQLLVRAQVPARLDLPAVDLREHGLRARFLHLAVRRVLPAQRLDQLVARVLRVGELLLDAPPEMEVEPQLGTAILLRLGRLPVPLQQPLRVRERAVLLRVRRRGQEEHLGRDLLRAQLSRLDLRAVVPVRRRLDLDEVADDEPVELREGEPVGLRVRIPDGGVLASDDEALDLPREHLLEGVVDGVVVVDARQLLEEELVVGVRVLAEVRLHQADPVGAEPAPPARR